MKMNNTYVVLVIASHGGSALCKASIISIIIKIIKIIIIIIMIVKMMTIIMNIIIMMIIIIKIAIRIINLVSSGGCLMYEVCQAIKKLMKFSNIKVKGNSLRLYHSKYAKRLK